MRVKSCNLTSVWNVQAAVVNECSVWVRNVAMRWKMEVTDHVKCDSSVWLLCRRVRRLQSRTVLQRSGDTADSSLGTVKQGVNPPVRRSSQCVPRACAVRVRLGRYLNSLRSSPSSHSDPGRLVDRLSRVVFHSRHETFLFSKSFTPLPFIPSSGWLGSHWRW